MTRLDIFSSNLKVHQQISKKRCFKKHCSCDQACQFSALQGTPSWRYLENLRIDDKFMNKRIRHFIQQTMCQEEKIIRMSQQGSEISVQLLFLKKYRSSHRRCRRSHQRISVRKGFLKNFENFTRKHLCWRVFFNKVAGLQPASFLKRGSNTSVFL